MKKLLTLISFILLLLGCEKNGEYIEYYENGQKEKEEIYKEGELIESKEN